MAASPEPDPCFPVETKRPPQLKGEAFKSLDDYLAWRRGLGATDYPFYEEIAPGRYRCVIWPRREGSDKPQVFTRAELARKYGFREKEP